MPTPKKGPRLGGSPAHQRLIVSNLATALFENGRITTTEARARAVRPVAEKLITKAKKAPLGSVQSLHNRREVLKTVRDKSVVHMLFTEIAPGFAERPGGYTRVTKIGPRKGDNAPMAVLELVSEEYQPTPSASKPKAEERAKPAPEPAADDDETAVVAPAEAEATTETAETEGAETETAETEGAETEGAEPEDADAQAGAKTEPAEGDHEPEEVDGTEASAEPEEKPEA